MVEAVGDLSLVTNPQRTSAKGRDVGESEKVGFAAHGQRPFSELAGRKAMPKSKHPSSEHHHQAAGHHHAAAHHHHQAAHHHDLGEHEEAKEHAEAAHEHSEHAHKHTATAHEHSSK